jgi:two-component SAPR family response regulator
MLFFAIDDEPRMLRLLHKAIAEAEPDAEIMDFTEGDDLLSALAERTPDVVFSDVELQGMTGLELAVRIKNAAPEAKIIFVTGYSQYAADAFRLHANGYIIKPAEAGRIREELDYLRLPEKETQPGKLRVQCFGNFEVFWQDKPITFARSKAKELLAYLIDREGAYCTAGEIISVLWEAGAEGKNTKGHLRVLSSDLSAVLKSIGMGNVLLKKRGQLAVDRSKLDCDYYRMREGDFAAVNAYRGEYMKQYSWAELTVGRLYFQS